MEFADAVPMKDRGKTLPYCGSIQCAGQDPRSKKLKKNVTDRSTTFCPDCGNALIYDFPTNYITDQRRHHK